MTDGRFCRCITNPFWVRLVRRAKDQQVLDGLVYAARRGMSAALSVGGDCAMGKTALLDYVAGAATGFKVLRVAGAESEKPASGRWASSFTSFGIGVLLPARSHRRRTAAVASPATGRWTMSLAAGAPLGGERTRLG